MTSVHLISIICTLLSVTLLGIYSVKHVKSSSDFAVGGRSVGSSMVVGTIVGTLVGGSSTIGTAQLAFKYGFSAWWFTLG
ncbi:MAG: sodium:solute symporter family protein, partial [Dehalobacterium sp.]